MSRVIVFIILVPKILKMYLIISNHDTQTMYAKIFGVNFFVERMVNHVQLENLSSNPTVSFFPTGVVTVFLFFL